MTDTHRRGERLGIGNVLKGVAAFLLLNWLWLLLVSLPLCLVALIASNWTFSYLYRAPWIRLEPSNLTLILLVVRLASLFVPASILFTLIMRRAAAERDRPTLLAGLERAPMVILSRLIAVIAVTLGYVLLVFPGVLLALAWSVALPVVVSEGVGAPTCLSRSADLTRGHRVAIFWLGLIYVIVTGVWNVGGNLLVLNIEASFKSALTVSAMRVISMGEGTLLTALPATLFAVGLAILYRELIQIRRGASAKTIAATFD